MRSLLFLIVAVVVSQHALAQQKRYLNTLYFEIGGNAGDFSLNYERGLPRKFLLRAGIGKGQGAISIPLMGGKLFGSGSHFLETTAGVVYGNFFDNELSTSKRASVFYPSAFIGYRYLNRYEKFMFHFGYSPIFGNTLFHGVGIAAGLRFN